MSNSSIRIKWIKLSCNSQITAGTLMATPLQLQDKKYLCEHCNKYLSFKTYCKHQKKASSDKMITVNLPSESSDSEIEGIFNTDMWTLISELYFYVFQSLHLLYICLIPMQYILHVCFQHICIYMLHQVQTKCMCTSQWIFSSYVWFNICVHM